MLLALLAIALPLQSTAIALSRLAPAHMHAAMPPSGELDPAPRASGDIGHAHDHEQEHAHSSDAVPSEAAHQAHHGHIAHHFHAHDDLSVVAMTEPAGNDEPLSPGKRALVDQAPIAGLAAWLPAPHEMMRPQGAKPRRFISHVSPPPERPPR